MEFSPGNDYTNVYFMSVDAKGHSSIVRRNDADKVDKAFDEFEEGVYKAVDEAKEDSRCQISEFWGWAGDGGLCIFYDQAESKARMTAMQAADRIVQELPALNSRWTRSGINGEIHVRIAIHKGSFKYKGDSRRGSIHSKELNFCVHLEKVLPSDSIGLSEDIYIISGPEKSKFIKADIPFEQKAVYLYREKDQNTLQAEWRDKVAPPSNHSVSLDSDIAVTEMGLTGLYSQRALTTIFPQQINQARRRVWVMGSGLGGFQSDHESPLPQLADRGIDIRILVPEPDTAQCMVRIGNREMSLLDWRDMETIGTYNANNLRALLDKIERINKNLQDSGLQNVLKLRYYRTVPYCAMLIIDSTVYFSPYLIPIHSLKLSTFQAIEGRRLATQCIGHFTTIWENNNLSRDAQPIATSNN